MAWSLLVKIYFLVFVGVYGSIRLLVSVMHLIGLAIDCHVQTETVHARALKVWPKDILIAHMLSL